MFKKVAVIVLCITMALSMAACGGKPADTEEASPTPTPTATPTPEPASESLLFEKYIEAVLNGAIHMEAIFLA